MRVNLCPFLHRSKICALYLYFVLDYWHILADNSLLRGRLPQDLLRRVAHRRVSLIRNLPYFPIIGGSHLTETQTISRFGCPDFGHPVFEAYANYCYFYPIFVFVLYAILYVLLKRRSESNANGSSAQDRKKQVLLLIQVIHWLINFN